MLKIEARVHGKRRSLTAPRMPQDRNISAGLTAKLKDSERMLSSLTRNLNGLVYCCLHDADWTMVFLSGDCRRLTGFEAASFLSGRSVCWEMITHPEDREGVRKIIEDAILTGRRFVAEYRIIDARGRIKWISERGCPIYGEDGKVEAIEGIFQDISQLKFSETAAHAAEARFRSIFENAIHGIYQSTIEGRYLNANPALAAIYGFANPSELRHGISDIGAQLYVDQGKRDEFISLMNRNNQVKNFEARVYKKDGEVIWISENARAVRNCDGGIAYYEGMVEDITARKEMETELRIAATAFETHSSMMITDADRVILRVNRAFTESTGYTAEEAIGKTPSILRSGLHPPEFYEAAWDSIQRNGTWQGEIWDRRKNGDLYPKWLTISAVKGEDGRVTHYVGFHLDISDRKEAEEKILQLAFYDPLTRLPNRRLLMEKLQSALASCARAGNEGALLFIDLDNFKMLNDTLGHGTGDLLLQQVAQRLHSSVREADTVARLGGDEFVVLLGGLSSHAFEAAVQTEAIGEKILALLNQPYSLDDREYHCTASIGISMLGAKPHTAEELMKQADIAMYQAKKSGRNAMRFFDPDMQVSVTAHAALEEELRKALELHQLQLHYQPQVDDEGRILGAETLIRWLHPEKGFISPAQFIPLAEESDLILRIGSWVLDTACAQIKAWEHSASGLVLAVNVSPKQFRQENFVSQVKATVQRHAIDSKRLKLELTEGMLIENVPDIIASMSALKEFGIQFSLDDFGTGYSSLQYLKKLPLNQLKIDQSFIRDMAGSDDAIVQTIIAMAQSLKLDVIAEGVETAEQQQLLHSYGCLHYQGYRFSKPLPIEEFDAFLRLAIDPALLGHQAEPA